MKKLIPIVALSFLSSIAGLASAAHVHDKPLKRLNKQRAVRSNFPLGNIPEKYRIEQDQ